MTYEDVNTPEQYGFPADDLEGRFVETPFGQEKCTMKRILWAYYDWLEKQDLKPAALIKHAYKNHPQLDVSQGLSWGLAHLAWYRDENGLENPSWLVAVPLPPEMAKF